MLKSLKKLSFYQKIILLFVLFFLLFIPIFIRASLKQRNINSKAVEPLSIPGKLITPRIPRPTPTIDPLSTPTITPTPTPRKRLTPPPPPPDNVTAPGPVRIRF